MYPLYPYPKISVVICSLNEEKNLTLTIPEIPKWVDEIILVDGHSTDKTIEVALKLKPDICILYQTGKGKGDALKFGVKHSTGDIIVTLDADGTYPATEIPNFVQAILNGYDFAKGTRFFGVKLNSMTLRRQFGNKILANASNLLFGTQYTDVCTGYYAFRKHVFDQINLVSDGFEIEQELFIKIKKMKFKAVEVPHTYRKRLYGKSKTKDFTQGLRDLLYIFSLTFKQ